MGMYFAVAAGCLLVLGLMRFAQSVGEVEAGPRTKQGAALVLAAIVIGFAAIVLLSY